MRVFFILLVLCTIVFAFKLPLFDNAPKGDHKPKKASDQAEPAKTKRVPKNANDQAVPEPKIGGDEAVPEPKISEQPVGYQTVYLEAPEIHQLKKDFYQSDIALTEEQHHIRSLGRVKRQGYQDSYYPNTLWQQDSPISYFIDSGLPTSTGILIRKALEYWSNHTCLSFQENGSSGSTKLYFFSGSGCWSYIGKVWYWGSQNISIGSDCQEHFGMITHEIGHALGLFHAQSRYDRDRYVTINTQSISSGGQGQFNKETISSNNNFGVKYDYGSVMHYSDVAFSVDGTSKTITAADPYYQRTMGGRIAPSFSDVQVINSLYNCTNKCGSLACQNGGYPNPSSCQTCLCPWGFGGTLCDQRQECTNGTCGDTITATTSWQTLTRWVGQNDTIMYDTFTSCYWHIHSAAGTNVQIQVQFVGLVCSPGCFYGGVEFKMTDFVRTGYRMCCSEDYSGNPTFTSASNLAIIGVHARYNLQYFIVQYRQV